MLNRTEPLHAKSLVPEGEVDQGFRFAEFGGSSSKRFRSRQVSGLRTQVREKYRSVTVSRDFCGLTRMVFGFF